MSQGRLFCSEDGFLDYSFDDIEDDIFELTDEELIEHESTEQLESWQRMFADPVNILHHGIERIPGISYSQRLITDELLRREVLEEMPLDVAWDDTHAGADL